MINSDGSEKGAIYKAVSIPPYFVANYLGAVGTIFDAPNWKQNFINKSSSIFSGQQKSFAK